MFDEIFVMGSSQLGLGFHGTCFFIFFIFLFKSYFGFFFFICCARMEIVFLGFVNPHCLLKQYDWNALIFFF